MNKTALLYIVLQCFSILMNAQVDDSKIDLISPTNGQEEATRYSRLLQEYYRKGDYKLHKLYSDSLLLISELYDIKEMSILALNSQAIYYKNISNREKAIDLYRLALEKSKLIPNNQGPKAMILANMGNLYSDIGAYQKSIDAMDTLLVITDTIRSFSKIKAAALVGQSTNYIELEEYTLALEFAKKAIDLGNYMQNEEVIGTALIVISDIYIQQGDYKNALQATEDGLRLPDMKMPTKKRAGLLLNKGISNYHLSDDIDVALNALKEALYLAIDKEIQEVSMHSYEYIAKIYEQQENFKASYEAQKEYTRIRDIIQNDKKETSIKDLSEDIFKNQELVKVAEEEMTVAEKNKNQFIIYGSMLLIILLSILLIYIKKKKHIELEKEDLQQQYLALKKVVENKETSTPIFDEIIISKNEETPYKNSSLTDVDREQYKERILSLMKEHKPYLEPNLRLGELASKLDMSTSHFSEVLHYSFKENFYNFINFYRVVEAQELMKKPSYKTAKIIAIAFDSGFKSKTTFNRVFKNYTGQTPSEYRKTV